MDNTTTMWEDLGIEGIKALMNIQGEIDMTKDSMNQLTTTKFNDMGSAFETIGRQLETGLLVPLGEKLLPHLSNLSVWLDENIDTIVNVLGSGIDVVGNAINFLAENMNTLLPIAVQVVATLGTFKVVTTITTGFTALTGAVTGLNGAFTLLTAHPIVATLSVLGGVVAGLVTTFIEIKEQQEQWNEQVERSIELANDLTVATQSEKANLEDTIQSIDALVNSYTEASNSIDEYISKNGDIAGAYRDLSGLSEEQIAQLEKEASQYDENVEEMNKAKNALENQYGTIEDAITIRDNYVKRLENSAETEKMLKECISEEDEALVKEGRTLQSTSNHCKALVSQKKALEKQDKLNATQQKTLDNINKQLIETLGKSIVAYNAEGEAIGVNIDRCNKEIQAIDNVAMAKLGQVNTINTSSQHIQQASKEECERIIQYCKLEIQALEARQIALEGSSESAELEAERVRMTQAMENAKARLQELIVPAVQASQAIGDVGRAGSGAGSSVKDASQKAKDAIQELTDDIKNMDSEQIESNKAKLEQIAQDNADNKEIINSIKEGMTEFAREELERELEAYENNDASKFEDLLTTLNDMKSEYKGYADAVEEIEKAITETIEEEYANRVEELEQAHEDMLDIVERYYDEKQRLLTEENDAEIDAIDQQIRAEEERIAEQERLERERRLQEKLAEAEDDKARQEAQAELDKFYAKQRIENLKAQKEAKKEENEVIKEGIELEKEQLKQLAEYQKQIELEKASVKKENQQATDEELEEIARQNLETRKENEIQNANDTLSKLLEKANEYENLGKTYAESYLRGLESVNIDSYFNSSNDKHANSHRNGLANVPFDGYRAELHKGEMVLTQAQADRYRNTQAQGTVVQNNFDTTTIESKLDQLTKTVSNIVRKQQIASNMA